MKFVLTSTVSVFTKRNVKDQRIPLPFLKHLLENILLNKKSFLFSQFPTYFHFCLFQPNDANFHGQEQVYGDLGEEMLEHAFEGKDPDS